MSILKPPNVLFTGYMGAGKTTIANLLVDRLGYTRISFATSLKEEAALILGTIPDKNNHAHRLFLQQYGQSKKDEDVFYWLRKLHSKAKVSEPFVVDDCRFVSEAAWGLGYSAIIIRILCDESTRYERLLKAYRSLKLSDIADASKHISEQELDTISCDVYLNNSGSLEETWCMLIKEVMPNGTNPSV